MTQSKRLISRFLSAGLSAVLVLLSPGAGCYSALAAVSETAPTSMPPSSRPVKLTLPVSVLQTGRNISAGVGNVKSVRMPASGFIESTRVESGGQLAETAAPLNVTQALKAGAAELGRAGSAQEKERVLDRFFGLTRRSAVELIPVAAVMAAGALAVPHLAHYAHYLPHAAGVTAVAVGMARSGGAGYKKGQEKLDLKNLPLGRIFTVLSPYKGLLVKATLLMTLASVVQMMIPKLFQQMIDLFIGKQSTAPIYAWLAQHGVVSRLAPVLSAHPWTANLQVIIGAAVIVLTVLVFLTYAQTKIMTYIGSIQMRDLSVGLYGHILKLPTNVFQKFRSGELTSVIDTNLYDLRLGATSLVTDAIKQIIMLALTTYFIVKIHPVVAVISFLIFALTLGLPSQYFRSARSVVYSNFYDSKRRITGQSQEMFGNIRILKAYAQEGKEVERYAALADDTFMDKGMKIAGVTAKQFATDGVLVWAALFAVGGVGGYYVMLGQLSISAFMSLVLYAYFYKGAFASLAASYKALGDTQGAARLVFDLWDRKTERYNDDKPILPRVKGDIEIKNLHFAYTQPAEKPSDPDVLVNGELVINGVDLSIPAGTSLAIVGKSGSGKTTLSDLIMRFMDPTEVTQVSYGGKETVLPTAKASEFIERIKKESAVVEGLPGLSIGKAAELVAELKNIYRHEARPLPLGTILVDGKNIAEVNLASYHSQFGLVPQEPYVFSGSVKNNIIYGLPDATLAQIETAARQAHAYDFIRNLDNKTKSFEKGLETVVGERGTRLSTGQKQRLMIARAFLLDPPILIMDEPTASLDAESEEAVVKAMENLMAGRTTIVVAHRLSTIQRAQKVIFLEKGKIAEQGTIEELLKIENGKFRAYWETQSLKEKLEKQERADNPGRKSH